MPALDLARPGFTIDGRPVQIIGWSCDASAGWGPRSFSGQVPESCSWAVQEAPLEAWIGDDLMWTGRLTQDPRIERGLRYIRAEGTANAISEDHDRLFYRIDDLDEWVEMDSDPHNYPSSEKYSQEQSHTALFWKFGDGTTAFTTTGNPSGVVLWVEGGVITKIAFATENSQALANFQLRIERAAGPSGTRSTVTTVSLNDTGTSLIQNVTALPDQLILEIECSTNNTPPSRRRVKVKSLKVYGRASLDSFNASDVVSDVADNAGFGTEFVEPNDLRILPLDWTEDHTALLDYMAELTDWRWMAYGDQLYFGPWAQTWTTFPWTESTPELEPMRRYNRVVVPYVSNSGRTRTVTMAPIEDPFPDEEVVYFTDELEHRQPDDGLATEVATTLAEVYSSPRMAGQVEVYKVRDENGSYQDPYHIRPGTLLDLPSYSVQQRIQAVTYREGGRVTVDLNDDFNLARLLADLRSDRRRNRRRKKKRKTRGGDSDG